MADQVITYTIPNAKVQTALQGFLKLYPNDEKDINGDPKYTNAEWVKERIRRAVVSDIRRGLQLIANEGVQVAPDDTIIT